jgi:hypothetical protein
MTTAKITIFHIFDGKNLKRLYMSFSSNKSLNMQFQVNWSSFGKVENRIFKTELKSGSMYSTLINR